MKKNQRNTTYSTKNKTKNLNKKVEISSICMNPTQKHKTYLTWNSLAKKLKTRENSNS